MNWGILLDIGNIIMFIGTSLLIRTVIKNKDMLQGYDLQGSILTFVALLCLYFGFMAIGQWISVIASTITVLYWGFVVAFKLKYRKKT